MNSQKAPVRKPYRFCAQYNIQFVANMIVRHIILIKNLRSIVLVYQLLKYNQHDKINNEIFP